MFLYTYASFKFITMVIFETIFANYPIRTLFRYSFGQIHQGCVLQKLASIVFAVLFIVYSEHLNYYLKIPRFSWSNIRIQ